MESLIKKCIKCNESKDISLFYKDPGNKDGLHSSCKVCKNANTTKNKLLVKMKKMQNKTCKYCFTQLDISYTANSNVCKDKKCQNQRKAEAQKNWAEKHPDKCNAAGSKRRASKLQRTPKWLTKEQFKEIEQFYSKAKELERITGIKHHVDHIYPLQGENSSGLHVPWNLRVITAEENLSKGNKLV